MGIETSVEGGMGRNIFLRGGYTYLDAVVQRSFTNDDLALLGPLPTYNGIPIGTDSPLQGARPFRRPPHTGFFSATYAGESSLEFSLRHSPAAPTTPLSFRYGLNGGDALLLPNRNLDFGYASLDLGGSYQLFNWLDLCTG